MTKITIDKAALEQVLEALEALEELFPFEISEKQLMAYAALRQALEQPRPAPPELEAAVNDALGLKAQQPEQQKTTATESLCANLLALSRVLYQGGNTRISDGELVLQAANALAEQNALLAQQQSAESGSVEPVSVGPEWTPCVKLPVTVHVREQRPGETHVSTREGITPVKADDLIMRGVSGEEYPIAREIFERTYQLGEAPHPQVIDKSAAIRIATAVGWGPKREQLTDEQIDRAIAELGLNYLADAANNRSVLRELCRRAAHGIKGDA